MIEMLLQSHDGAVHLLPALPDVWKDGNFKGLRVRNGGEVDAVWSDNKLTSITLKADVNNSFKIKIPEYASKINSDKKQYETDNGFIEVELKKGERVKFEF